MLKPVLGSQIQLGHPLARGLVGCWLMNEGSGSKVADLSGNGNVGTLIADTHFVGGKFGSALSFDGTGDYVDLGNATAFDLTDPKNFTMSLWFNVPTTAGGKLIIKGVPNSTDGTGYDISLYSNPGIGIHVNNGSGAKEYIRNLAINYAGAWHHVVATFNNSLYARLYYDSGQIVAGQFTKTPINTADSLKLTSEASYLSGLMDNVQIWNRALSAQEVRQLYMSPFGMFEEEM